MKKTWCRFQNLISENWPRRAGHEKNQTYSTEDKDKDTTVTTTPPPINKLRWVK